MKKRGFPDRLLGFGCHPKNRLPMTSGFLVVALKGNLFVAPRCQVFLSAKARNFLEIKQVSNQDSLPTHYQMSGYHFQLAESKELQLPKGCR